MIKKSLFFLAIVIFLSLPEMSRAADGTLTAKPEILSLDHCLELAGGHNPSIRAAGKKVEIATAAITEAKGAYWPKLDYTVFADKAQDPSYPYDQAIFPDASTEYSGAALSLTASLYHGGKNGIELQLAKTRLQMALENERQARQQLTFQVKQAFYQAWLTEQMLKVAQSSFDNLQHHEERTANLYKLGTVSQFELLRARVQRDSLKPRLIAAENDFNLARLSLALLIGLPTGRPYSLEFDAGNLQFPENSALSIDKTFQSACQNRPEMRQVQQEQTIQQSQKNLAEAGLKPDISLVGQYGAGSLDYTPSHWNDNKTWTLALTIKGNLFDGFSTPAKIQGAQKDLELTKIQEKELGNQIRLEVEQAAQNIQQSLEGIQANQSNIELAKESLKQAQGRFEAGLATTMDIMDSELALDQALNGYYRGVALFLTAQANLDLATGKD